MEDPPLSKVFAMSLAYNVAIVVHYVIELPARRSSARGIVFVVMGGVALALQYLFYELGAANSSGLVGLTPPKGGSFSTGAVVFGESVSSARGDHASSSVTRTEKAGKCSREVPLSTFASKHLVLVGDSTMRYQYQNLVYRVTHGAPPPFEFWEERFQNTTDMLWRLGSEKASYPPLVAEEDPRVSEKSSSAIPALFRKQAKKYDHFFKGTTQLFTHTRRSNWRVPFEKGSNYRGDTVRVSVTHHCDCGRPRPEKGQWMWDNRFHATL